MLDNLLEKLNLQQILTEFVQGSLAFLPKLFVALLILAAAFLISRAVRAVTRKALERAQFNKVLIDLLIGNILHYMIIGFGLVMALSQLGVNVGAALAGIGVVGIAVGFAAQDSVANMISGFLIFWDKPFKVGDWVETEGHFGRVQDITLRTTRIRTASNTYVVVPNKRIIDEVLENYSKNGQVRVDAVIGIGYQEDVAKARAALLEAVSSIEEVLNEPSPDVVLDELGGSSVNLKVRVWVESADLRQRIYFKLNEVAKAAIENAGIEIPFPHLQLIVDSVEERVWDRAGKLTSSVS